MSNKSIKRGTGKLYLICLCLILIKFKFWTLNKIFLLREITLMLLKQFLPTSAIGFIILSLASNSFAADVKYVPLPKDQLNIVLAMPEIYIDGEIDNKTLPQIKNIVANNKLNQVKVIFNSEGGSLVSGLEIGEYLRENEFSTDVGTYDGKWNESRTGECYSSCVYSYIGGKYRFYDRNSKFGVHQFYNNDQKNLSIKDVEEGTQFVASILVNYIKDMGVDVRLFTIISEQTSNDIELLDYDEMKKLGIFNDGFLNSEWEYLVDEDGAFYFGTQEQLDKGGIVGFSCNGNSTELSFLTKFGNSNKSLKFTSSLLIEDEYINLTVIPEDTEVDDEGLLTVSYVPKNIEVLKIMKANKIGFSHTVNGDTYEFTVDMYSKTKENILDFIEYCKSLK